MHIAIIEWNCDSNTFWIGELFWTSSALFLVEMVGNKYES